MARSLTLLEDVCARLCHDLGSSVGGMTAALGLLDDPGGEAAAVIREGVAGMGARLRLWRAAVAGQPVVHGRQGLADLLRGGLGERVVADLSGLEDAARRPGLERAILIASMLAAEGLPRGGSIRIGGTRAEAAVIPEGRNAAWPAHLTAALAGAAVQGPREVLAPLLLVLCREAEVRPALAFGAPGAAPLVLSAF